MRTQISDVSFFVNTDKLELARPFQKPAFVRLPEWLTLEHYICVDWTSVVASFHVAIPAAATLNGVSVDILVLVKVVRVAVV